MAEIKIVDKEYKKVWTQEELDSLEAALEAEDTATAKSIICQVADRLASEN